METFKRTPLELFNLPQHFLIPLFQRPYVWDEDEQWEPLWKDVRRTAELRMAQPHLSPKHFLGAVVLQAQEGSTGILSARNVIDGQQRLTTLQLFMDATAAVLDDAGQDRLRSQLERLTHNAEDYLPTGSNRLKIRHSNKDHEAFDEVMSAEVPIAYADLKHATSKIARAHAYFSQAVSRWLGNPADLAFEERAQALVDVLQGDLQLVTIELLASENSQEIFETLNARGTPLTAADLIRNYVFQRLEAEGADTGKAYAQDWPFESSFWETTVSVGRYPVGRSSLFLNQWLIARTGDDIGPQATFTRFKAYVEHETNAAMADLLPTIKMQAQRYESWTAASLDSSRQLGPVEMSVYRMRANNVELLKPILIWLHEPGRDLSQATIACVIQAMESWVTRRMLLRLPGSDLGRIVADVIRTHSDERDEAIVERVVGHLSGLNVTSTYWPSDEELRSSLANESSYQRYRRPRLRMILEAIEDHYRAETNQSQLDRKGYPIEHVLPQKWTDHWQVEGLQAQQDRAAHVHRLGNLTLLTDKLNPRVSNAAWPKKRKEFLKHNTINMTGRLVSGEHADWDESVIDARTAELTDILLQIWPVPPGHAGSVVDPQAKAQDWVQLKHLLSAGLLQPGDTFNPRSGQGHTAVVRPDGKLDVGGKWFDSPSGAARHVTGRSSNGWKFWRLSDGRELGEVRAQFSGEKPAPQPRSFDWTELHRVLEQLPQGRWVSYGSLAEVIGTAPQPLGNHITSCAQCVNAHRVLTSDGRVAPAFRWSDAEDTRDPVELLKAEGVMFVDGRADRVSEIRPGEIAG